MSTAADARRDRTRLTSTEPEAVTQRPRAPRRYFEMNGATMVSIAAIALTIIGMLYLVQISQVASLGYELSRMQERRDSLSLEISELKYEVARYESLHTVEEVARVRLGMSEMNSHEFITIESPLRQELAVPAERSAPPEQLVDRALRAIFGVGWASSVVSEPGAHGSDGSQ